MDFFPLNSNDFGNEKKTPNSIKKNRNESLQVQVGLLHAVLFINKIQKALISLSFSTHYHICHAYWSPS